MTEAQERDKLRKELQELCPDEVLKYWDYALCNLRMIVRIKRTEKEQIVREDPPEPDSILDGCASVSVHGWLNKSSHGPFRNGTGGGVRVIRKSETFS